MTVNEFVKLYKENSEKAIESLEMRAYLPVDQKQLIAQAVVDATCTRDENGIIKVDGFNKEMILIYRFLIEYTALEIDSAEILEAYDALCECGALDRILSNREFATIDRFAHTYLTDKLAYENSPAKILSEGIDAILESFSELSEGAAEAFGELIENIDMDKITGLIGNMK